MGHARLHRPRAGQHLGHEDEVLAELDADDAHAGDEAVVHDLQRFRALLQRLEGQRVNGVIVALDQGCSDLLHLGPHPRE